jgi:hypothetical protein
MLKPIDVAIHWKAKEPMVLTVLGLIPGLIHCEKSQAGCKGCKEMYSYCILKSSSVLFLFSRAAASIASCQFVPPAVRVEEVESEPKRRRLPRHSDYTEDEL